MRIITLALAVAAIAAPAFADTAWTAAPASPSSKVGFVGDSVIWNCGAGGCTSQSDTSGADPMSECLGLARQLGPLTAFAGGSAPFTDARLAHCNEAAPRKH